MRCVIRNLVGIDGRQGTGLCIFFPQLIPRIAGNTETKNFAGAGCGGGTGQQCGEGFFNGGVRQ
jgi:hypothetical protein